MKNGSVDRAMYQSSVPKFMLGGIIVVGRVGPPDDPRMKPTFWQPGAKLFDLKRQHLATYNAILFGGWIVGFRVAQRSISL